MRRKNITLFITLRSLWRPKNSRMINQVCVYLGQIKSCTLILIFFSRTDFYSSSDKTVTLVHVAPQFQTGLSNSYRCIKEQQLDLTLERSNVTAGLLKVTNLQFQAFRGDNTTIFGLGGCLTFFLSYQL